MDRYVITYKNDEIIRGIMTVEAENEHQARFKFCQKKGDYNSIIKIEKVDKIDIEKKL